MFLPVQPKPLKTWASVSMLPGLIVGLASSKPAAWVAALPSRAAAQRADSVG